MFGCIKKGTAQHGLPQSCRFRKKGEWSASGCKRMACKQENGHPTGDHGESKKWFPQQTGEKGAGNIGVSETGESLLLLEHADLCTSPLELWNCRNTQPQSKGNVVGQEGEDYTEQALLLGVIEEL